METLLTTSGAVALSPAQPTSATTKVKHQRMDVDIAACVISIGDHVGSFSQRHALIENVFTIEVLREISFVLFGVLIGFSPPSDTL
jgi:hypothetical protein